MITPADNSSTDPYVQRHFRFGWWSLLLFLSLGLVLEALHGFKVQGFLADQYEARRLVWRLAHAHGTLLGLVHIAYAYTLSVTGGASSRRVRCASSCLNSASVLLPGGFFLGGIYIYDGDPGLGVFLAPIGGLALLVAVFCIARDVSASGDDEVEATGAEPVEQEEGEQE